MVREIAWGVMRLDYYDALAALGVESAHPGGFEMTQTWLSHMPFEHGQEVLEVGCGVGKTACEISRRFDVLMTAVDVRKDMIEKAKARSLAYGVNVDFLVTAKHKLPFRDAAFDYVIAESVTVFNPIVKILQEYARVLKNGGMLLDVEMASMAPLPPNVMQEFRSLYHAVEVPTISDWKKRVAQAGFNDTQILLSGPVTSSASVETVENPMLANMPNGLGQIIGDNQRVMSQYGKWLNFIILTAKK